MKSKWFVASIPIDPVKRIMMYQAHQGHVRRRSQRQP